MAISRLLTRLRQTLKQIGIFVWFWHFLKMGWSIARYRVVRLFSVAAPLLMRERAPLRGFHRTTKDFCRKGHRTYIELGTTCEGEASSGTNQLPSDLFVAEIPSGRVVYDQGATASPDNHLLADVSWLDEVTEESQPRRHPAMLSFRLPELEHISGSAAVISSVRSNNYYHWLFDILPRFELLNKAARSADFYLISSSLSFQRESLSLLKVEPAKVINLLPHSHFCADLLLLPSLPGPVFGATPQPFACNFLRSAFLPPGRSPRHRLLYLTRCDAAERRVLNEAEVRELILPLGFEVVTLAKIPFTRQLELFSEAKVVLGPHGAGFANAVFCQAGAALVEFMPKSRTVDCFERLARLCNLNYRAIDCEVLSTLEAPNSRDDHTVDIVELSHVLAQIRDEQSQSSYT